MTRTSPQPLVRRCPGRRSLLMVWSALLSLLMFWAGAAPAQAHTSIIKSSTPADGTQVDYVDVIELQFATAIKPEMATYALTVDGGHPVDLVDSTYGKNNQSARFQLRGPLPQGQYRLGYQLVAADNHPVTGWIGFRIGPLTIAPQTRTPTASAPPAGPDGASHPISVGVSVVVGAAVVGLLTVLLLRSHRARRGG